MDSTAQGALIAAIIAVVLGALGLIGGVTGYVQGSAALRRATLIRQRAAAAEEAALQAKDQAEQAARTAQSVLDRLSGLRGSGDLADLPTGPLVLPHRTAPAPGTGATPVAPSGEVVDARRDEPGEPAGESASARPPSGPREAPARTPAAEQPFPSVSDASEPLDAAALLPRTGPTVADAVGEAPTSPAPSGETPTSPPPAGPTAPPGATGPVPFAGLRPPGRVDDASGPTASADSAPAAKPDLVPTTPDLAPAAPSDLPPPAPAAPSGSTADSTAALDDGPARAKPPAEVPAEPEAIEVEPPQRSSTGQVTAGGQAPPPLDWAEALRTGAIPLPARSRGTYSAPTKAKGQPVGPARFEIRAVGRQRYEAVNVGGATAEQASLEGAGDDSHLVRPVEARPKPVVAGGSLAFSVLRVEGRDVSVRITWMLNGDEEQAELPVP